MEKKVCWSAIQIENNNPDISKSGMNLRPSTTREWNEDGFTKAAKESFFRNAAKIWNQAPDTIKRYCHTFTYCSNKHYKKLD